MEIEELFKGIAVIIDDEIDDPSSGISKIKTLIQNKNIPVVTYKEIPDKEIIPALANSPFIIVDWDYTYGALGIDTENGERISMPSDYKEYQEKIVIDFLTDVINNFFVPVFLFTSQDIDSIKISLDAAGLWQKDENRNRIFIKDKKELLKETDLFNTIETWLRSMPPAYVLKIWELQAKKAKNNMFLDMYNHSPYWVEILWRMMKNDVVDYQHEFGEFITRSLCNRMEKCEFEEDIISRESETNFVTMQSYEYMNDEEETLPPDELHRVLEGERYFTYKQDLLPKQFYTGDLFKEGNNYYLNIRAQCDLARENGGDYDPILYLIKGKKLRDKDIRLDSLELKSDCSLSFGSGTTVSLVKIAEICQNETQLNEINKKIYNHENKILLRHGTFIERADKVIVSCIAGEKAIQFSFELTVKKSSELEAKRIGRILPPYITRIQQRCAQYAIREGVMPIPEELFR